jgi:hypothetical protein
MMVDQALRDLRAALAEQGMPTLDLDARGVDSGYPAVKLPSVVLVWRGPEWFRWFDTSARIWRWHPIGDPIGAARHLVALPGSSTPWAGIGR